MQTQRFKRIAWIQSKLVALFAAIVIGVTSGAAVVQTYQNNQTADAVEQANENAEFWRIIAGTEPPRSTSNVNELAIDLRNLLAEPANPDTGLPEAITSFQASPNDYGRVDRDLGFDPFNPEGQNCSACGSLNPFMLNQLRVIKAGGVEQLISQEVDEEQIGGFTLTPFGIPVIPWVIIVYLTATVSAIVIAIRRDSRQNDYLPIELNWQHTGGSVADQYKQICKVISPAYFFVIVPIVGKFSKEKGGYQAVLKKIGMEGADADLRAAFEELDKLPPEERARTINQLEMLRSQLDQQVGDFLGDDRVFQAEAAEAVRKRITSAAERVAQTIEVRNQALRELEDPTAKAIEDLTADSLRPREIESHASRRRRRPTR